MSEKKFIKDIKSRFPIGSIIKHKNCNLFSEIVSYEFVKNRTNHCGILCEHTVILKVLYSPIHKFGVFINYDIFILSHYNLSDRVEYDSFCELKKAIIEHDKLIDKYEQLHFNF